MKSTRSYRIDLFLSDRVYFDKLKSILSSYATDYNVEIDEGTGVKISILISLYPTGSKSINKLGRVLQFELEATEINIKRIDPPDQWPN